MTFGRVLAPLNPSKNFHPPRATKTTPINTTLNARSIPASHFYSLCMVEFTSRDLFWWALTLSCCYDNNWSVIQWNNVVILATFVVVVVVVVVARLDMCKSGKGCKINLLSPAGLPPTVPREITREPRRDIYSLYIKS